MKRIRNFGILAAGCLLLAAAAKAQTLQADYQLQGVYTSSAGSLGPLTVVGDATQVNFTTDTVDTQTQQVLQIGVSGSGTEGGVQTQVSPFVSTGNYSAVLLSNFQIATTNSSFTKVFDFKNLSSDAGLYINDATGLLGFYDGAGLLVGASSTPVLSGQYVQIVLTRNSATNVVTVYANGAPQFSFTDTTNLAVLGDATNTGNAYLTLYKDDGTGIGGSTVDENTHGNIARLRIYDGVLSDAQVAGLDRTAAIPEPASWLLVTIGGAALVAALRRRPISS